MFEISVAIAGSDERVDQVEKAERQVRQRRHTQRGGHVGTTRIPGNER